MAVNLRHKKVVPVVDVIIHEIYNAGCGFYHRLVVNGIVGKATGYRCIAENGDYRATIPEYWGDTLPEVFSVSGGKVTTFKVTTSG